MTQESFKRKLTAILSADVEGYSRLMGEDEETTVQTLTSYRDTITDLIETQNGRVADAKGDNILAEFASVVDAVRCAVEIQRELKKRNDELPDHRKMEFRIGINLGDIIEDKETIYGDGVNIAARLESISHPGGICISGTAYDHVKNKLDFGYEYLGEQSVKNIPEPVRVYRVLIDPEAAGRVLGEKRFLGRISRRAAIAAFIILIIVAGGLASWNFYLRQSKRKDAASLDKMAFPLPDEPSIAVLPFDNLSGDPQQDYFSDGLSDHIITNLSKVPHLFVIARNSTFTYKGKPVKVQKVSEDLGVRYVLEGSVQKTADRIRVTAQLIDAIKGHHLWAESYDREVKDIFAVQDKITMEILKALQVKLTGGEKASLVGKGTDNLEAYQKCLQALDQFQRISKEGNILARKLAEEAITLDPKYPVAHRIVGWTHFNDARFGWSLSRSESFKQAVDLAQKAIELDDTQAGAYSLLSMIHMYKRRYEKAIAAGERALSISPNGAHYNAIQAIILNFAGRPDEAIELTKKAMRLSPIYPGWFLYQLGLAYRLTGQYDQAIETLKRCRELNPEDIRSYTELVIVYSQLGQMEEAQTMVSEILKKKPKFSLAVYAKSRFYKDPEHIELELDALRKAGLPKNPPLPLPDKPSIAVLAFENLSGDPNQEYFCDGIAEEIITALSKIPTLFVIARKSSFTYKGKTVKVQQVGRELGVRYVLEGSVRKAGDRVRITAKLVDAITGNHLWAERYDRHLKDIFALQDEITMKIITGLRVKLTVGEQARLAAKGTKNLQAYLKYLQGGAIFLRITKEDNALARQIFEEVIELDPEYAPAYQILGATYWMDVFYGSSKSPKESLAKAMELNQKAIALDDSYAAAHAQVGWLYTMMGKHEEAIAQIERAIELAPNSADAHMWMGYVLRVSGRNEEAIRYSEQAIRLNPIPPSWYFRGLALNYMYAQRYDEAISTCKKGLNQAPNDILTHVTCAAIYGQAGHRDAARAEAEKVLKRNLKFSAVSYAKRLPYKNQSDRDFFLDGMRKAGLPD
jgi:adenylate cyclase